MATISKRVVFLTGPPKAESLTWATSCNLGPRFRRYLGTSNKDDEVFLQTQTQETATHPLVKWRHVLLKGEEERVEKRTTTEVPQFLSFEDEASDQPSQEHMKFLEHSLAVLQSLDSSQIAAPDHTTYDETTFVSAALSFNSDLSTSYQTSYGGSFSTTASDGEPSQQSVNFTGQITDLRKIPTARHLETIHPQTMTINVLASVISIQPTRTVKLRKRAGEMDIVEVLLGDETRAGFNISFWLPPTDSQRELGMRGALSQLRSGDVLLIAYIALGEFKGNVYGQSLSKRITRNNTSLIKLSSETTGLPAPTMAKLKRVIEWTGDFVGRPAKRAPLPGLEQARSGKRKALLPPDTQPGEL